MSHYTCLVIGENPEAQLAPFHEFECTGDDNEYVLNVDITAEVLKEYQEHQDRKHRDPEGNFYSAYEDRFYRDPTPAETAEIGPLAGTGGGHGLSWTSKDWGDGRGYRTKIHFLPEGWTEVEVPAPESRSFAEFAADWYGMPRVKAGEPRDHEATKYGWISLTEDGSVAYIIKRTNPRGGVFEWRSLDEAFYFGQTIGDSEPKLPEWVDRAQVKKEMVAGARWDWYVLGGRWSGFFQIKPHRRGQLGRPGAFDNQAEPGTADQARKRDIDFGSMRIGAEMKAAERYDAAAAITQDRTWLTWDEVRSTPGVDIGDARTAYWAQSVPAAFKGNHDYWEGPDEFRVPREEYLANARRRAISTFAVIKDGVWYERGKMGWWACVSDEKAEDEWLEQFEALIDGLPEDTLLSVWDCHI